MRVLIGCEMSGQTRDAFCKRGHDAWSCDLLGREQYPDLFDIQLFSNNHIVADVLTVIDKGWDLAIFYPPCTHLAVSGARWFKDKLLEQALAVDFVQKLWAAPIEKVAIENPIGVLSRKFMKPTQIVQPWMFGHEENKATCLWLRNLPKLKPSNEVAGYKNTVHEMAPSPERGILRSLAYLGMVEAMARQWG